MTQASSSLSSKIAGRNSGRILSSDFFNVLTVKLTRSAARFNSAGVILPSRSGKPEMSASLEVATP